MGDDVDLSSQLPKIKETTPLSSEESVGKKEEADLESRIKCDRLQEEVDSLKQDRNERKKYADKTFTLVCVWLIGVFIIIIFSGFLSEPCLFVTRWCSLKLIFRLPEALLIAIVGGTTASVIGIFLVVANYLFPKR